MAKGKIGGGGGKAGGTGGAGLPTGGGGDGSAEARALTEKYTKTLEESNKLEEDLAKNLKDIYTNAPQIWQNPMEALTAAIKRDLVATLTNTINALQKNSLRFGRNTKEMLTEMDGMFNDLPGGFEELMQTRFTLLDAGLRDATKQTQIMVTRSQHLGGDFRRLAKHVRVLDTTMGLNRDELSESSQNTRGLSKQFKISMDALAAAVDSLPNALKVAAGVLGAGAGLDKNTKYLAGVLGAGNEELIATFMEGFLGAENMSKALIGGVYDLRQAMFDGNADEKTGLEAALKLGLKYDNMLAQMRLSGVDDALIVKVLHDLFGKAGETASLIKAEFDSMTDAERDLAKKDREMNENFNKTLQGLWDTTIKPIKVWIAEHGPRIIGFLEKVSQFLHDNGTIVVGLLSIIAFNSAMKFGVNLLKGIKSMVKDNLGTLKMLGGKLMTLPGDIISLGTKISGFFSAIWGGLVGFFKPLFLAISIPVLKVVAIIGAIFLAIAGILQFFGLIDWKWADKMNGWIKRIVNGIGTALLAVMEFVVITIPEAFILGLWTVIKWLANGLITTLKFMWISLPKALMRFGVWLAQKAWEGIKWLARTIVGGIAEVWKAVKDNTKTMAKKVLEWNPISLGVKFGEALVREFSSIDIPVKSIEKGPTEMDTGNNLTTQRNELQDSLHEDLGFASRKVSENMAGISAKFLDEHGKELSKQDTLKAISIQKELALIRNARGVTGMTQRELSEYTRESLKMLEKIQVSLGVEIEIAQQQTEQLKKQTKELVEGNLEGGSPAFSAGG